MPRITILLLSLLLLLPCTQGRAGTTLVVSIREQRLAVLENGMPVASYPVSTSRFGVGDSQGSYATPLGELEVAQKIGDGAPLGAVFKARHWTGEVLHPNATGRDPIVTRILWLRGLEAQNQHAHDRGIYIHGTPVEHLIGRPASYGCIRMRSRDIVNLFAQVGVGARIIIQKEGVHAVQKLASVHNSRNAG